MLQRLTFRSRVQRTPRIHRRIFIQHAGVGAQPQQVFYVNTKLDLALELVELRVAAAEEDQLALRVEHHQAMRHVVHGIVEERELLLRLAVTEGADQADGQEADRDTGYSDREVERRNRQAAEGARRIGNDLYRAHCGEVMRDDGEREQARRKHDRAAIMPRLDDGEPSHAEQHAEDDRGRDKVERPHDLARQLERRHAQIMHAGDAAAEQCTAEIGSEAMRAVSRDGERDAGDDDCGNKRDRRQWHVVGDRDARLISQHRNKMRCPNAGAGRDRSATEPQNAGVPARHLGARVKIDSGKTRRQTDEACDHDQTQVVLSD